MMDEKTHVTTIELQDSAEGQPPMKFDISLSNQGIEIRPHGYGTNSMNDGESGPIWIELHNGEPRVHIWGDINLDDTTDSITLDRAKESLRLG